jgi:hypothetical protein
MRSAGLNKYVPRWVGGRLRQRLSKASRVASALQDGEHGCAGSLSRLDPLPAHVVGPLKSRSEEQFIWEKLRLAYPGDRRMANLALALHEARRAMGALFARLAAYSKRDLLSPVWESLRFPGHSPEKLRQ